MRALPLEWKPAKEKTDCDGNYCHGAYWASDKGILECPKPTKPTVPMLRSPLPWPERTPIDIQRCLTPYWWSSWIHEWYGPQLRYLSLKRDCPLEEFVDLTIELVSWHPAYRSPRYKYPSDFEGWPRDKEPKPPRRTYEDMWYSNEDKWVPWRERLAERRMVMARLEKLVFGSSLQAQRYDAADEMSHVLFECWKSPPFIGNLDREAPKYVPAPYEKVVRRWITSYHMNERKRRDTVRLDDDTERILPYLRTGCRSTAPKKSSDDRVFPKRTPARPLLIVGEVRWHDGLRSWYFSQHIVRCASGLPCTNYRGCPRRPTEAVPMVRVACARPPRMWTQRTIVSASFQYREKPKKKLHGKGPWQTIRCLPPWIDSQKYLEQNVHLNHLATLEPWEGGDRREWLTPDLGQYRNSLMYHHEKGRRAREASRGFHVLDSPERMLREEHKADLKDEREFQKKFNWGR